MMDAATNNSMMHAKQSSPIKWIPIDWCVARLECNRLASRDYHSLFAMCTNCAFFTSPKTWEWGRARNIYALTNETLARALSNHNPKRVPKRFSMNNYWIQIIFYAAVRTKNVNKGEFRSAFLWDFNQSFSPSPLPLRVDSPFCGVLASSDKENSIARRKTVLRKTFRRFI